VAPPARDRERRHHDEGWKGTLAMQIDTIKQNELTASERTVLAEDRERWKRMGAGAHLDDWLAYGNGLMIRRRMAMRIAYVNRPEGRGYATTFAELMKHDGLDGMDKTSISCVLWLHDEPERLTILREIRDTMKVGERARLNSPISARQRVEKLRNFSINAPAGPRSRIASRRYHGSRTISPKRSASLWTQKRKSPGSTRSSAISMGALPSIRASIHGTLRPRSSRAYRPTGPPISRMRLSNY
jgi:hypothetical protein